MNRALVIIACCLVSFLFILPGRSEANATSLAISPTALKIRATQPASISAPFTITNQGNDLSNLQIQLRFFRDAGKNDGTITYIPQNDVKEFKDYQNFSEKIRIFDGDSQVNSISLGPKQQKKLTLKIDVSQNQSPADYYFSVIFLTDNNQQIDLQDKTSMTLIQSGIAMNVLLSIGSTNAQSYLDNFSTSFYIQSGPVPFTVRIANVGSQFVTPKGQILIKNMFGQLIGKVDLAPASILAGSIRTIPDLMQYTNPQSAASTKYQNLINKSDDNPIGAIWTEEFLLGFYTATLYLTVSPGNQVYIKTIHFIAFPIQLLMVSLAVVIITIVTIIRIRARMNNS